MKADPRTPPEFAKLPKWLVARRGAEFRGHIVHCHYPRFVMTVDLETGSGMPLWIDKPSSTAGASAQDAALVLEATDQFRAAVG